MLIMRPLRSSRFKRRELLLGSMFTILAAVSLCFTYYVSTASLTKRQNSYNFPLGTGSPLGAVETALPQQVPSSAAAAPEEPSIAVVGDLHGDFNAAVTAIRLTSFVELIFNSGNVVSASPALPSVRWLAGRKALVFTGDVFDRGPDGLLIVELIVAIRAAAEPQGGKVFQLLGNHELMNLHGDFRYVHQADFASFGGPDHRAAAWNPKDGVRHSLGDPSGQPHPRGYAIADYLLKDASVGVILGDVLLVHAGISRRFAASSLASVEETIKSALRAGTQTDYFGDDGPLWDRSLITAAQNGECGSVAAVMASFSKANGVAINAIVVGHTIQMGRQISFFCGGHLVAIDTSISSYVLDGTSAPSALHIFLSDGPAGPAEFFKDRRVVKLLPFSGRAVPSS